MFTPETIEGIRARVFSVTGIHLPWETDVHAGQGLCVTLDDGKAAICAEDENALARGFFLLSRCVKEGRTALSVCQKRHFASCGVMADVSRGAVMKVEAVKRFIDHLACLGMNMLMLYTEDTYEVPEYPYMGYLRGRYSQNELRELDAYAAAAGVELVPCIQTLGHMRQFLQWKDSEALRDQADILLIVDEKTYALIEAAVKSMRSCMKTSRIHIGMDEAHGVGLGQYLLKNGVVDRHDLLVRHLERVVKICEKHGFRPIMWSDMFFRLGSKTNEYYDLEAYVPQHVIDSIPEVDLCYWDYYHDDEAFYDAMLSAHARMGGQTVFAGGVWTWSGFLPQVKKTEATMFPALSACARHQVDTVFATMWGDDGAETNLFLAAGLLPIFSEACWQGHDCPREEMVLAGEALTGMPRAVLEAMGEFYPSEIDMRSGKSLIWCDLLYPLLSIGEDTPDAAIARCEKALETLHIYEETAEGRYACLLFDIVKEKARLARDLRAKYIAGDREWLGRLADADIPQLMEKYAQLRRVHQALWERDMKRFGWEVICLRYGAAIGRLADVADEIKRYLAGELDTIEELDVVPLGPEHGWMRYQDLVTPSVDFGTGF
ncbi:MAG: family 20 glycosylhydrolase [Clostridia bacterium]|nr:family 20 glycosylhydrolase [Clostridia bacterium]